MRPSSASNKAASKHAQNTSSISGCSLRLLTCAKSDGLPLSEQENQRTDESSNVDDRTEHEIYALPVSLLLSFLAMLCLVETALSSYARFKQTLHQLCVAIVSKIFEKLSARSDVVVILKNVQTKVGNS